MKGNWRKRKIAHNAQEERIYIRVRCSLCRYVRTRARERDGRIREEKCSQVSCHDDTDVTVLCPGGRCRSKDKDIVLVYVYMRVCCVRTQESQTAHVFTLSSLRFPISVQIRVLGNPELEPRHRISILLAFAIRFSTRLTNCQKRSHYRDGSSLVLPKAIHLFHSARLGDIRSDSAFGSCSKIPLAEWDRARLANRVASLHPSWLVAGTRLQCGRSPNATQLRSPPLRSREVTWLRTRDVTWPRSCAASMEGGRDTRIRRCTGCTQHLRPPNDHRLSKVFFHAYVSRLVTSEAELVRRRQ